MKDPLCSYYTNSDEITSYMVRSLTISPNDTILEPSAGEGIFIDEILKTNRPVQIDALDIDKEAVFFLKKKYKGNSSVRIWEVDTLLDERLDLLGTSEIWLKNADTLVDNQLDFFRSIGGHYDKVIGNPPYGAWQDYDKRNVLKKKYPGQYVKETYSLFLLRCISVLKQGGKLSFIIPDTYLFLNLHSKLRKVLLTATKVLEILIFPSNFFPGISFGYSNLSIITLERADRNSALANTVKIVKGFKSASELPLLANRNKKNNHLTVFRLKQSDILNNVQHRFILADSYVTATIKNAPVHLGDVANVVTGLCTGDNKQFVRVLNSDVKRSDGYGKIDPSLIFPCSSLQGIKNVSEGYIPYVKGTSTTRYYRPIDEWFVRWDKKTILCYNHNKKARFQNSSYYFRTGIAIPMVKASNVRAFLLENKVFDQSIVGIFPKDASRLYYILALMNSDAVNKLIHVINPTANNSANYIKQIPYLEPSPDLLETIENKVKIIINCIRRKSYTEYEKIHKEVNSLIDHLYWSPTLK